MKKIGRNDLCPCGNGTKYKKCHGSAEHLGRISRAMDEAPKHHARAEAAKVQRERQQGFGAPIISAEVNGLRLVAVKDRLFHSSKWKTFQDFLIEYIATALTPEWANGELAKLIDQRHPILVWYHKMCEHQRKFAPTPGKVFNGTMTGAYAAYLHLAYDLYALEHNAELQVKLLDRLRNRDNFPGAYYEIHVAAILIRAGFDLVFENEDDRSTTHCEFTATYKATGRKFSVEAKRREGERFRLVRLLTNALKKTAKHQRIVFIDCNAPDDATGDQAPAAMSSARDRLRMFEETDPASKSLPPAHIFITNTPWQHHLDQSVPRSGMLVSAFHIPEIRKPGQPTTLRQAIDARDAHVEIYELLQSMLDHVDVPSTFDGQAPEFAFGESVRRLIVGDRYAVPLETGKTLFGTLMSAVVMETEKIAMCSLRLDDGTNPICPVKLSESELQAWRRHPDTFFGIAEQRRPRASGPLEMYDFLMGSYSHTPKQKLLEYLAAAPDIAELHTLDQKTLASIYCERMAGSIFADGQANSTKD